MLKEDKNKASEKSQTILCNMSIRLMALIFVLMFGGFFLLCMLSFVSFLVVFFLFCNIFSKDEIWISVTCTDK